MSMLTKELIFGGVSKWLMRSYLDKMGYQKLDDNHYSLADVHVRLADAEPHRVGNLVIKRIAVTVSGSEQTDFDKAVADIRFKAMRGGG